MNRRRALQRGLAWALLISGGLAGGPRASGEEEKAPPALSYENLLQGLRGMRGPELLDLVKLVGTDPELPRFGEEQLTSLLTELERIRKEDPFKDEFDTPRGIRKTVYPNRGAARPANRPFVEAQGKTGAGRQGTTPSTKPSPQRVCDRTTISTEDRKKVADDSTVQAAMDQFGVQQFDIRRETPAPSAQPPDVDAGAAEDNPQDRESPE